MEAILFLTEDERAELDIVRLSAIAREAYSHALTSAAFDAMGKPEEAKQHLEEMESLNLAFRAVKRESDRWEKVADANHS